MAAEMAVSVDRDFARFGKKSYAINKINSVEVREKQPYGQTAILLWGLATLIFVLAAWGQFRQPGGSGAGIMMLLFVALFAYLTYRASLRSKIVEYQLFLMTSSSEAQALVSRDGDLIERLRNRIEQAMAGQLA